MRKYRDNLIPKFCDEIPNILENGILYISEKYKTAIHLCACGCGEHTVTPLGDKNKLNVKEWNFINNNGLITLDPSIGNSNFNCKSHYWIQNNRIISA